MTRFQLKHKPSHSRSTLTIILAVLCCLSLPASAQNWELAWSDEFDGASIDSNKWEFQLGDGTAYGIPGWGNNELQWYRMENATIENGHLIITAKKEQFAGHGYTSARMRTRLKGDWTYGRFEMRARLPSGKGLWPAFWMLPTDNAYGGWAASGEIDIMELVGHEPNKAHGTIHYGGEWPNNTFTGSSHILPSGNFSDDFHLFSVEWKPGEIRWCVDGVHYQTQTRWWSSGGPFPAPFDRRFHILLNVAVGGNWPGNPDSSTTFPQRMEVDYVRAYQDPNITEVKSGQNPFLPKKFALYQNYPNPFNPTTIIRYDLPQPDFVTLEIYNTFGQRVSMLVNKQQLAGQYLVRLDGRSLSAGVYICSLKTKNFQHAFKMILMK